MQHRNLLLLGALLSMGWLSPIGFCQEVGVHWKEDAGNIGLAAGALAPDFQLLDQTGSKRSIAALMGPNGLAIVFFRSADWCIYCKGQLAQLQRDLPALKRAGLGVAAISYDSPAVLRDFASRRGIRFPLLSDHESTVIRAFGVADRKYHEGSEVFVDSASVPVNGIAYSAVFVLSRSRKVLWRFAAETEQLRLTGSAIVERAAGLVSTASRMSVSGGKLRLETTASNTSVGLGMRLILGVDLKIPPGLHVYGPMVTGDYRGVAWDMESSQCATLGEPAYPTTRLRQFAFELEKLPIYEGDIRITRELIVPPSIQPNNAAVFETFCSNCLRPGAKLAVGGALKFQVCDENQCFPPESVPLKWEFDFVAPDRERVPIEIWRVFEQPESY
jgi:peroxiredoxin